MQKRLEAVPFQWERIGDVLRIRGTLLDEGTWTGLDGQPVFYSKEVIREGAPTIISKPIKSAHKMTDEAVVGFWTAYRMKNGTEEVEGIVFDPDEITRIQKQKKTGISPEMDVDTEDRGGKVPHATDIRYTAGALVESPACKTSRVESAQLIRLKARFLGSLIRDGKGRVFLQSFESIREEKRKMATEGGQPSREEFFTQLEDQLKANEGIDDTTLPIIMEVLKGAIKTVPVPKPVTPTTTGLTEDQVKKLFEKLYAAKKKKDDEEEEEEEGKMAKPTRASYLRWLRKELKGAGFDRDAIAKVMAIVKAAVKTPYPYPSPQKVKGEAAEVWEEDVKELEDEVGNLEKTITEKEGEITTMKTELDTLRAAETKRKEDAITGLVNTIKEVDEGFDAEKYLENVEDLDSKMTLLNKYHETIQRLKPAISLGGVDATPEGEARINKVLMETFGTTELFPKEGED